MKSYSPTLRISAWTVIFLAVFGLACRESGSAETDANTNTVEGPRSAGTQPSAPAAGAGRIAVTVNGVDIAESDVEAQIKPQLEKMAAQLPPAFIEQYKKQLRQQVLEKMIVERLLDEKVKAAKIAATEEEVIDQLEKMASAQKPPLSLEDFKALVKAYGQSFDEVKQQIQRGLGYQKLMEAQWTGRINVTEDDAKKYYSENTKQFEMPEQVRASHILIKPDTTDPNTDPNDAKEKAKTKAGDLLKQVKGGVDFAELARANSSCPSSKQGGDLNFFGRGQMAPAFEKAAFELKVGQVSDIVETRFGYHIIKITDHKDPNVIAFEQAKGDIENVLTQQKQGELAKEYIESLKAEANIVYPAGKEPNSVPSRPSRP
jgi:peptidyl-prolyl cis-trans isomerase C